MDVLCISSIDWDFIWQGHQEIMSTLAAQGHRVLFLENTGVRAPRLRDLPRVRSRIRNWRRGTEGFREERQRLFVYSPMILPFPYSRVALWINRWLLLRSLRRWMRVAGFSRPVVWTFLPTPLALDLIQELDPALTVYYCIDDLASSSPAARRISKPEVQLFRRADLVFVTSEKLRARAAQFARRVHLFPFGVSYGKFERVREGSDEIPADLKELPHPVAGYVGGVHQWVDQDLIAETAARLPEMSFALVGPPQVDVSRLARCPNVHLLGARPHDEVPRYIKGFSVGMVPYHLSEYTAHVYPTKLSEYLAMGVPVVATDLAEIRRFNDGNGDMVDVAADADAFAAAIRRAATNGSATERQRRIEVGKRNSWESIITEMSRVIDAALVQRGATGTSWQESLRQIYRSARRRIAWTLCLLVGLYILIFHTPLLWGLAAPLRIEDTAGPADAIVVFGGGAGESGEAGGGYQERAERAIELYRLGLAPRIVFSSGFAFTFKEAEVMKAVAEHEGVPSTAIDLETRAANTYENVRNVVPILNRAGAKSALLVSSPYHMRRALLVWRKAAPEIAVIAAPVHASQFYEHGFGATFTQIQGIAHEYVAMAYYWLKGWI